MLRTLDHRGATAIEYALLIALIAIAGTSAFMLAGERSQATMTTVASSLDASKTLDLPAPPKP
jgi:Flp pilus assembly pilin Flp